MEAAEGAYREFHRERAQLRYRTEYNTQFDALFIDTKVQAFDTLGVGAYRDQN